MDWNAGQYETTAAELAPAAGLVVEAAGVTAADRVLDVACGTGNAALAAAARGAAVVGVDSAERLLGVAGDRAAAAGVGDRASFVAGDAEALPVGDGTFDVALSVFGVIFAGDAQRAARELLRAVRPGGRIVLATWIARGPIADMMRAARQAATEGDGPAVPPATAAPQHLDWGATETLERLFAPARVIATEHAIAFTGTSPRAWIEQQDRDHPSWHALRATLSPARYERLLDDLTELLSAGDVGVGELRVDSPCLVARIDVPA